MGACGKSLISLATTGLHLGPSHIYPVGVVRQIHASVVSKKKSLGERGVSPVSPSFLGKMEVRTPGKNPFENFIRPFMFLGPFICTASNLNHFGSIYLVGDRPLFVG